MITVKTLLDLAIDPIWRNFQYLRNVLQNLLDLYDFVNDPKECANPYLYQAYWSMDHSRAISPININPIKLNSFQTQDIRQHFLRLLRQIMSEDELKKLNLVEIKDIKMREDGKKYDVEIHFSNRTHCWPILFYFDHNFLLKDFSANYKYQKICIQPPVVYRVPLQPSALPSYAEYLQNFPSSGSGFGKAVSVQSLVKRNVVFKPQPQSQTPLQIITNVSEMPIFHAASSRRKVVYKPPQPLNAPTHNPQYSDQ